MLLLFVSASAWGHGRDHVSTQIHTHIRTHICISRRIESSTQKLRGPPIQSPHGTMITAILGGRFFFCHGGQITISMSNRPWPHVGTDDQQHLVSYYGTLNPENFSLSHTHLWPI